METQKVDVIICTPGHSVMSQYLRSLLATTEELSRRGITWAFSNEYSSNVADAREMTLNGDNQNSIKEQRPFKGTVEYKKLFWIDSDIAWTPDDFMKLYESDKDVISGAYLLASGEVTAYQERLGKPFMYDEVKEMTEPVKVHGIGFGFVGRGWSGVSEDNIMLLSDGSCGALGCDASGCTRLLWWWRCWQDNGCRSGRCWRTWIGRWWWRWKPIYICVWCWWNRR